MLRATALCAVACVVAGVASPLTTPGTQIFGPWDGPGGQQLPCWRIPALVRLTGPAGEDKLLVFAEGRWYWGDGCNKPGGGGNAPTGPISKACQAKLDARCNDPKKNAECIDPTVKAWGRESMPMVALYSGPGTAWRCYSHLGVVDMNVSGTITPVWNGTFLGFCSEDGPDLSAIYKSCPGYRPAPPPPPVHPPPPPGAERAIFSRSSTDGGKSWGEVKLVAGNGSALGTRTDPGPMWHEQSKTLVLAVGGAADPSRCPAPYTKPTLGSGPGTSCETWLLKSTE